MIARRSTFQDLAPETPKAYAPLESGCSVMEAASNAVWFLALWLLGAGFGYLLPRPKWFPGNWPSLLLSSLGLRKLLLAAQGLLIIREIWYKVMDVGTARNFAKASLFWCMGRGWHFDFPSAERPGVPSGCAQRQGDDSWYVSDKDLAFFRYHGEGTGATQGAGPWEVFMEKEIENCVKCTAWRRVLPNGKTEYKTLSICADATAEEFMDLYLDDDSRPTWDTMITKHEVLEHGEFAQRQQVVRWIRKFPFSFITDREYIIGRRFFRLGNDLYGITKAVDHPRAPSTTTVVKMDVFYSMWRSRTVACPWASGKPAVETLLLHHEQFKIPENLSRFAVRHGMWGFVKKMSQTVPSFVEARRARGILSSSPDPEAFGAGFAPNPPLLRSATTGSSLSSSSFEGSDDSSECNSCKGSKPSVSTKLRGLAAFALASSLALLAHRRGGVHTVPSRVRGRLSRSLSLPVNVGKDRRPRRFLTELETE